MAASSGGLRLLLAFCASRSWLPLAAAEAPQDAVNLLQVHSAASADNGTAAGEGLTFAAEDAEELNIVPDAPVPVAGRYFKSRPAAADRLLLFWSVGSHEKSMRLVEENIRHARAYSGWAWRPVHIDVYLAHYNETREPWQRKFGKSWYQENVQYSALLPGRKVWLAKDLLLLQQRRLHPTRDYGHLPFPPSKLWELPAVDIYAYEYIWLLDEDANFTMTSLRSMVDLARESGASVMEPAFNTVGQDVRRPHSFARAARELGTERATETSGMAEGDAEVDAAATQELEATDCQRGQLQCHFQEPWRRCRYRYVNFIEVSFPLMRPVVFDAILGQCKDCMPERLSSWELDHIWCSLSAVVMEQSERRTCAILDGSPMVHANIKTLPKYGDKAEKHKQNIADNWTQAFVSKHLKRYRFSGDPQVHKCIE